MAPGELGMIVYLRIARCTRYYVIFSSPGPIEPPGPTEPSTYTSIYQPRDCPPYSAVTFIHSMPFNWDSELLCIQTDLALLVAW